MIVAPERQPETPDTVIAQELLSYLRMMVRLRKIDATSGPVRELESALMRTTESGTLDLPSDGLARLGAAATAARERELVDLVAGIFGRR